MKDVDVVIVGAGLTGLRAALEISRAGLAVLIIEKGDSVGGRVRTDRFEGFQLDHGFQVLLTAYPEYNLIPGFKNLQYGRFTAGARIWFGTEWRTFMDPIRETAEFFKSLKAPIASVTDLIKFAWYTQVLSGNDVSFINRSINQDLELIDFSARFLDSFVKPFLRGVLLDPSLSMDAGLARFYLKIFSRGYAALPLNGIQSLPDLLAESLGREHIILNTPALTLRTKGVTLENGDDITARYVICACDALSAAALGGPEQTTPHASSTTLYFAADEPPYSEPIISLVGDGTGPINNLAVVSNVQPNYAPAGRALISASVLGHAASLPELELLEASRKHLYQIFGAQSADWEFIKSYRIHHSVPARPRVADGWIMHEDIYYAGDYLSYGSQNGALKAGRLVGQEVCREILE